jgi:hypothetical protein
MRCWILAWFERCGDAMGRVFYHKFQKYALVSLKGKKGDSFTRRGSIKLCVKLAAFGAKKRTKAVGHHRTRVSGSKGAFAKQHGVVGTLYKHLNFLSNRTQSFFV